MGLTALNSQGVWVVKAGPIFNFGQLTLNSEYGLNSQGEIMFIIQGEITFISQGEIMFIKVMNSALYASVVVDNQRWDGQGWFQKIEVCFSDNPLS